MASGTLRPAEIGVFRKGDTIDLTGSLLVFLGANNIGYVDIYLSKIIPSGLTPTANGITVSACNGNGSTSASATFRACARQNPNVLRVSFNFSGATAYHPYQIIMSAGTITFE